MSHTFRRVHLNKSRSNGRVRAYFRIYSEKDMFAPKWKHLSDSGTFDSSERKRVCVDVRESALRRHNRDALQALRGQSVNTANEAEMDALLEVQPIRRPLDIAWDYT